MELFGLCRGVVEQQFRNVRICDMYDEVFARFYEKIVRHTKDVQFFQQLAEVFGKKILELGCGSGRVMLPLLEAGCDVTGVDLSENMLNLLQEKMQHYKGKGKVICGDMCTFECTERFDLALLPESTLNIIDHRKELFHNIYAKLKDNGRFVISYIDYDNIQESQTFPSRILFDSIQKSFCIMTEKIVKEQKKAYVNLYLEEEDESGQVLRNVAAVAKNMISQNELDQEIKEANFKREQRFVTDLGKYHLVHEMLRKTVR